MKPTLFLLTALVCLIPSCKVGCTVETTIATGLIVAAEGPLKCKNHPAVERDINAFMSKTNLCPSGSAIQTGAVCSLVANAGVTYLGTKIPAEWDCDPSQVEAGASTVLTALCSAIPLP